MERGRKINIRGIEREDVHEEWRRGSGVEMVAGAAEGTTESDGMYVRRFFARAAIASSK